MTSRSSEGAEPSWAMTLGAPLPAVTAPGKAPAPGEAVVFATRLALGLAAIAGETLAGAAGRAVRGAPPESPGLLGLAAGAAVGLGFETQRWAVAAVARMSTALAPRGSFARTRLEPWYRRGLEEQRRNRELADRFSRAVMARLAVVVLAELDLDAVADRIDVERILARVDLDEVADRIDLDRIIERLDLARLSMQVMNEIDMVEIMRESTSSLAGESVDALRVQGMNADRLVSRIIDRLLMRKPERQTRLRA